MNRKLPLILLVAAATSCTTSMTVRDGGGAQDQSGDNIKTLRSAPRPQPVAGAKNELPPVINAEPVHRDSESLQRDLDTVKGELEDVKHHYEEEVADLQSRMQKLEEENLKLKADLANGAAKPVPVNNSKSSEETVKLLWDNANAALAKGDRDRAEDNFKSLAETYPKHERARASFVALGMINYGGKNYKDAAIAFNSALDRFPKKKSGLSIIEFGVAASAYNMGNKEDGKLFFEELIRKYPKTPATSKAKSFLAKKSKLPEDLFKTFPNWLDQLK